MTESSTDGAMSRSDDEFSLLELGTTILRWRRSIIVLTVLGAIIGLAFAMLTPRKFRSDATFLPQDADQRSELALAATQFGLRLPQSNGTAAWGPPVYVALLRSRTLLEPIVLDSVTVEEEGGRRVAVPDLLNIKASSPRRRTDLTIRELGKLVSATESRTLGTVKVTVTTRWPSVSLVIAEQLVRGVNQFNVRTRKSHAAAAREFAETQSKEAERALREAEDRMQLFLQRNRVIARSPELTFAHDRLQREIELRQQVYTSLIEQREEARIREVRNLPVITVLEAPRLPIVPENRKTVPKFLLGGLGGLAVSTLLAFFAQGMAAARRARTKEALEFFQLVENATPRFLRERAGP